MSSGQFVNGFQALSSRPAKRFAANAPPRVSAVVVNWNRLNDVLNAVRSLRRADYPQEQLEIIVVDNGSTDGSAGALARENHLKLIELGHNAGPSAARNAGIAAATGDYILLLDSDALLARRGLRAVVEKMESERDIAVAGLRILSAHTGEIDQWIYAQPYATHGRSMFDTYSFSAAGALLRASAVRAEQGFWEQLFIYNEEVDLSIRMIRAGHRVVYLPLATVFHRPSHQGRADQSGYFRYQIRNWIWIFLRHYPTLRCWWMIALYSAVYLIKGSTNGRPVACMKGIVEGLAGLKIARIYTDKMTSRQARHVNALNVRRRIRLWNIAATPVAHSHQRTPESMPEIDDAEMLAMLR